MVAEGRGQGGSRHRPRNAPDGHPKIIRGEAGHEPAHQVSEDIHFPITSVARFPRTPWGKPIARMYSKMSHVTAAYAIA